MHQLRQPYPELPFHPIKIISYMASPYRYKGDSFQPTCKLARNFSANPLISQEKTTTICRSRKDKISRLLGYGKKEISETSGATAIVRTAGKQFAVKAGQRLVVDRVTGNVGDTVTLGEVLLFSEGETIKVGTPLLSGAKVTAKIIAHSRGPKVRIFKKKITHGYTKKQGHRQDQTQLLIETIAA